jgi:predicted AAA+ superfamily ATPase
MNLKRDAEQQLEDWYALPSRSPLVLFGPRQTGKTTLIRSFVQRKFGERAVEINFYKDRRDAVSGPRFAQIFEQTQDPRKVLEELSILIKREIDPERDLLFIDEIQDCKSAYEILKNFKDDYPGFPIITSGSYLGLFLETETEIRHPVGATHEATLGPLSFREFLINFNPPLYSRYQQIKLSDLPLTSHLHTEFLSALNTYLFTGGLPEPLFIFLSLYKTKLLTAERATRDKQSDLLAQYLRDIDKYAKTTSVKKLKKIFEAVPIYLERFHEEAVDRLRFDQIEPKATYRELRSSFDYLKFNGLVIESRVVRNPKFPLAIQQQENEVNRFKLFMFDIGLLNCALNCPYEQFLNPDMGHYKGYIMENFVAQNLIKYTKQKNLFSFKHSSREQAAEIEFLLHLQGSIVPLEVKSAAKYKRSKSLDSYINNYNPKLAFKCTLENTSTQRRYTTVPIYLIEKIFETEFIEG